jgi:hypothetical protein
MTTLFSIFTAPEKMPQSAKNCPLILSTRPDFIFRLSQKLDQGFFSSTAQQSILPLSR